MIYLRSGTGSHEPNHMEIRDSTFIVCCTVFFLIAYFRSTYQFRWQLSGRIYMLKHDSLNQYINSAVV